MFRNLTRMTSSIKSAGCLIIGDEVLNGKIHDVNSFEFAKYCFRELSIPVKKTIVCGDDKDDIIRSLKTLTDENCDFIVTSGGIGSTHDDITYEALADAFRVPCTLDDETVQRMQTLRKPFLSTLQKPELDAFYRMATLPQPSEQTKVSKLFIDETLWVPIVGLNEKVYVLPGVPQLFKKLLVGLGESVKPRCLSQKFTRFFVKTRKGESNIAPFLTELQNRCDASFNKRVKIGSYPHFDWKIVTVSIIGDKSVPEQDLRKVVEDVVKNVDGEEITAAEEDHLTTCGPPNL
ncbi:hypothetical protein FT663_01383 [Candidozyma haemuli var. vulneris]|nr:hypothetical protein FT662_01064 [[Candida] haemuloni var. vulneris]KAF3994470.1 hypothetical protein FT663_01383 [[Candida] haemuloni var. vulneris]